MRQRPRFDWSGITLPPGSVDRLVETMASVGKPFAQWQVDLLRQLEREPS